MTGTSEAPPLILTRPLSLRQNRDLPGLTSNLLRVLAELGHACPGACCPAAEELGAIVWFCRQGPARDLRRDVSLVVIDTSGYRGPMGRAFRLLHQINQCAGAQRIHVLQRRDLGAGHDLVVASPSPLRSVRTAPPSAEPASAAATGG